MAKKTDNNAAFLEKFKECEQLIRQTYGDDKNFKWFEDKMKDNGEDQMSQKMYVCRVLRNYMSHNPDGGFFIDISDAMADFLDDVKTKISGDIKICKDEMSVVRKFYTLHSTVSAIAVVLNKIPAVPIVDEDKNIIAFCTDETIRYAVSNEAKAADEIALYKMNQPASEVVAAVDDTYDSAMEKAEAMNKKIIFVADDKRLRGIINLK